jgi:hypothetical protein
VFHSLGHYSIGAAGAGLAGALGGIAAQWGAPSVLAMILEAKPGGRSVDLAWFWLGQVLGSMGVALERGSINAQTLADLSPLVGAAEPWRMDLLY